MFTWISDIARPAGIALAGLLALSACQTTTGPVRTGTKSLAVLGGQAVLAAPSGYCIDRSSVRTGRDQAFALIGSCASLTGDARAPRPFSPGVLSILVSRPAPEDPPVSEQFSRLGSYFRSSEGRAALSPNGDPDAVTIVATRTRGGAFVVHARVAEDALEPNLLPDRWRAVFDLNGWLASASVYSHVSRPQTVDTGNATLNEFVQVMQAQNPATPVQ